MSHRENSSRTKLVEPGRIELPTSCVQGRRSPSWAMAPLYWSFFLLDCVALVSRSVTYRCMLLRSFRRARLAKSKKSCVKPFGLSHSLGYIVRILGFCSGWSILKAKLATSKWAFKSGQAGQKWWVWVDSNHRPHPYQGCALTNWATDPSIFNSVCCVVGRNLTA